MCHLSSRGTWELTKVRQPCRLRNHRSFMRMGFTDRPTIRNRKKKWHRRHWFRGRGLKQIKFLRNCQRCSGGKIAVSRSFWRAISHFGQPSARRGTWSRCTSMIKWRGKIHLTMFLSQRSGGWWPSKKAWLLTWRPIIRRSTRMVFIQTRRFISPNW